MHVEGDEFTGLGLDDVRRPLPAGEASAGGIGGPKGSQLAGAIGVVGAGHDP
jgi:hypothetical protein